MKYISDIISISDIKNWSKERLVFIRAGTGCGKTTFIKTTLLDYCNANNKNILYLANRAALKLQTESDLKNEYIVRQIEGTSIDCITYQGLSHRVRHDLEIQHYDYVICDEAHYFFEDASFNRQTDIAFNAILKMDAIKLLMSATLDITAKYIGSLGIPHEDYPIPVDYNQRIDTLYFYNSERAIKQFILEQAADDSPAKIIYFTSASKAYEISSVIDNASFYCSENNQEFSKYNDKDAIKSIVENCKFENKVLATTSVLDCGINIKDKNVVFIISDYCNPLSIIQQIGRKRFESEDEHIVIFVKNYSLKAISKRLAKIELSINQVKELIELGEISFGKKYEKKYVCNAIDVISENNKLHYRINKMAYFKLQYDYEFYLTINNKDGFKWYLTKKALKYKGYYRDLDFDFDKNAIDYYFETLIEKKLFKSEQEQVKYFITSNDKLFNNAKENHGSLGLKMINTYLKQINSKFIFKSKRENSRKSSNYKKTYWEVAPN